MNLFTDLKALGSGIWPPRQSHLKHSLLFCVHCWATQGLCFCCFFRPSLFLPQGRCTFAWRLLSRCSSVWFFLFIEVSGHTSLERESGPDLTTPSEISLSHPSGLTTPFLSLYNTCFYLELLFYFSWLITHLSPEKEKILLGLVWLILSLTPQSLDQCWAPCRHSINISWMNQSVTHCISELGRNKSPGYLRSSIQQSLSLIQATHSSQVS